MTDDEIDVIDVEPPYITITDVLDVEAAEAAEALIEVAGDERRKRFEHVLRLGGMAYRAMTTSATAHELRSALRAELTDVFGLRRDLERTGAPFEEATERLIARVAIGFGDSVMPTSTQAGIGSGKVGDRLVTVNPAAVLGQDVRIAIECKRRDRNARTQRFSQNEIRKELDEARRIRNAAGAIFVTNAVAYMPSGRPLMPFDSKNVAVAFDPEGDGDSLTAAYLMVRAAVVHELQKASATDLDRQAARRAVADIEANLNRLEEAESANATIAAQAEKSTRAIKALRQVLVDELGELNHHLQPKG